MAEGVVRSSDAAVVLCADGRYFPPAYVVCSQLARDAAAGGYAVVLLTEPGPHLDRVPRDAPFIIRTPDFLDRLPNIPDLWRSLPPFAYLRLLVPDIVTDYRRLLYLDSDVRIGGPIAPLLTLDMKGVALAAVDGVATYTPTADTFRTREWAKKLRNIGLDANEPYFNSGMLLIDAETWRRDGKTEAALACLRRFGALLTDFDQDALNVVFRNAWLAVSPRWNFADVYFESEFEALLQPAVYHNLRKPWKFGEASRREVTAFRRAISDTPYPDFVRRVPSYREIRRYAEGQAKAVLQRATPFIPSSAARLRDRGAARHTHALARHLIANVTSRRFADVDQNITTIDLCPVHAMLKGTGRE